MGICVIFVAEFKQIEMKKTFILCILATFLAGCSHHTYVVGDNNNNESKNTTKVAIGYPNSSKDMSHKVRLPERGIDPQFLSMLPNATAFRMSGDYANNVAVTFSQDGELLYFPAPTDITADSEPISLGEGWWLNNQGLGPNSVFTKYTFAEYAALPEVPSPQQIKLAVIPGAKVTGFMELPMKIGEAANNIEEAKEFVKNR